MHKKFRNPVTVAMATRSRHQVHRNKRKDNTIKHKKPLEDES